MDFSEITVRPDMSYDQQPVEILDRKQKQLRNKTVSLVRVLWRHDSPGESTWEREEDMRERYPSLFVVGLAGMNSEGRIFFSWVECNDHEIVCLILFCA